MCSITVRQGHRADREIDAHVIYSRKNIRSIQFSSSSYLLRWQRWGAGWRVDVLYRVVKAFWVATRLCHRGGLISMLHRESGGTQLLELFKRNSMSVFLGFSVWRRIRSFKSHFRQTYIYMYVCGVLYTGLHYILNTSRFMNMLLVLHEPGFVMKLNAATLYFTLRRGHILELNITVLAPPLVSSCFIFSHWCWTVVRNWEKACFSLCVRAVFPFRS